MKRDYLKYTAYMISLLVVCTFGQIFAQIPRRTGPAPADEIKKARKVVEANMDSLNAHKKFIYAMGIKNPELLEHYKMWMREYPQNVTIPLSIGTVFYNAAMSEARDFLLEAAAKEPGNGGTWIMLADDANLRGQTGLTTEYLEKATQADPSNAGYAYAYLKIFENSNPDIYKQKVSDFINQFPGDKSGANALYRLGQLAATLKDKIYYYEEIRKLYPFQKLNWSAPGMEELSDIYLQTDPEKALALINEMGGKGNWVTRKQMAETLIETDKLEQARKYSDAVTKLEQVKTPHLNYLNDFITLKKAALREKAGDVKSAYDSLAVRFATLPSDALSDALESYGTKVGKDKGQIREDIEMIRSSTAAPAFPFELGLFTSDSTLSLKDLRGKVVLLTFWFPGCAPCHEEFPHFQAVVDSFGNEDLVYIGINGMPLSDGYVLPYLENHKFSFIPLHCDRSFAYEKYGVEGYPDNFLIDKDGMIVFKGFRTNHSNHRTLELMISSLLEKETAKQ